MSVDILSRFLPENALHYIKYWIDGIPLHIAIKKRRQTKLGDYRKRIDGSHEITINGDLPKELFFFVLTHEIAHLLAFEKYSCTIQPHGKEWKTLFGDMLRLSITIYPEAFQKIILRFSESPKANFMASPELVTYFKIYQKTGETYIQDLIFGDTFMYKGQEYQLEQKNKKRYLCKNLKTEKVYLIGPLVLVERKNK